MTDPKARQFLFLRIGVLGLIIASYYLCPGIADFVSTGITYLKLRDFEGLRQFILAYGIWAPLTSIALMTIQSMIPLVPGLAITITNAWIFGWEYGALYSWIGALCGAILDFGIARWYGRPVVERFIEIRYLDTTDKFFKKHGVLSVFITRLTPVIPFKVVSYGAGLTAMPLGEFIIATGLGQTPAIILYSILGQNLTKSIQVTIAVSSLLLIAAIAAYHYRDIIEKHLISGSEPQERNRDLK